MLQGGGGAQQDTLASSAAAEGASDRISQLERRGTMPTAAPPSAEVAAAATAQPELVATTYLHRQLRSQQLHLCHYIVQIDINLDG